MIHGIINVNKPEGFTSHDVVAKLRGILKQKKIGHTGTLDPNATGVLPVCLGKATKLCDLLTDTTKEYHVTFALGKETDTEDVWGTVTKIYEEPVDEQKILPAINSFVGDIMQVPPMFSAKKINGKKLYELAREGKVIERDPVPIRIEEIHHIIINYPEISMDVVCSKGTYIRSLCRDIGHKLGNGAYMTSLVRTQTSGFSIENAHTIEDIEALAKADKVLSIVTPIEDVFQDVPKGIVDPQYHKLLFNGNPLRESCFLTKNLNLELPLRVYDNEEHFIGIYQCKKEMFFPNKIFYDFTE